MFSIVTRSGLDWIEQGLTFPPTQYRLSGRQFYRSKDPTNSIVVVVVMTSPSGAAYMGGTDVPKR